jgi:hypothetical protein
VTRRWWAGSRSSAAQKWLRDGKLTLLLHQTTSGLVPSATTSVRFELTANRNVFDSTVTAACVDLLSFVLTC